jgi:hypothetical protein
LLIDEVDDLMLPLMELVQKASRASMPQAIRVDTFRERFLSVAGTLHASPPSLNPPDSLRLKGKLGAAGLTDAEIRTMQRLRADFSLARRRAVGHARKELDDMADIIQVACIGLRSERLDGSLAPGLASFQKTIDTINQLHNEGAWKVSSRTLAYGALHDITARCQNEYV